MPRVVRVAKAQKTQGTCESCSKPIEKGSAYKWVKARYGPKRNRHDACPNWKASELTGSDKLSTIFAAQEAFHEGKPYASPEDYAQALRDAAESIREAAEAYRESAQNMEDGFGHETSTSQELSEKGDEVESWADEIDSAADTVEGLETGCDNGDGCELDEDQHHEFAPVGQEPAAGDEEEREPLCVVCQSSEEDGEGHHKYEEKDWHDEADGESSVIDDCPV